MVQNIIDSLNFTIQNCHALLQKETLFQERLSDLNSKLKEKEDYYYLKIAFIPLFLCDHGLFTLLSKVTSILVCHSAFLQFISYAHVSQTHTQTHNFTPYKWNNTFAML